MAAEKVVERRHSMTDRNGRESVGYPNTHMSYFNHSSQVASSITKSLFYPVLASFPVYTAMVTIGFLRMQDCPMDENLPRCLFFSGISGVSAVFLRVLMLLKWRGMTHGVGESYTKNNHPAFNMVRCIMYLFLLVAVTWNVLFTKSILHASPSYQDPNAADFCDPLVYKFSFVLIILSDFLLAIIILIFLVAIAAVVCFPDIMIYHYYGEQILPPKLKTIYGNWFRRKKANNLNNTAPCIVDIPEFQKKAVDCGDHQQQHSLVRFASGINSIAADETNCGNLTR